MTVGGTLLPCFLLGGGRGEALSASQTIEVVIFTSLSCFFVSQDEASRTIRSRKKLGTFVREICKQCHEGMIFCFLSFENLFFVGSFRPPASFLWCLAFTGV